MRTLDIYGNRGGILNIYYFTLAVLYFLLCFPYSTNYYEAVVEQLLGSFDLKYYKASLTSYETFYI